ncbi:molecular chaperone DnaJ [bacterium]|nr:molecular chaperone DnaJ [bacterium]
MKDLYEILGVNRSATEEELKRAYRQKAKECHPDTNSDPEAENLFKELSGAYAILSDPQKRRQYDTYGTTGRSQDPFAGMGGFDISDALRMFMEAVGGVDPFGGSFFGGGFGGSGRASRSRKGGDLQVTVKVSLEEILSGAKKKIKLSKKYVCKECGGSGIPAGAKEKTCPDCGGTGRRRTVRASLLGSISTVTTCSTCGGTGTTVTAHCPKCSGEGRIDGSQSIDFEVPPGVSEGNYLVMDGKGNAGIAGGPPGNLIIFFKEIPHKVFNRRGEDLYIRFPLTFSRAALGAEVKIPTLEGEDKALKIPSGTQFGQTFKLKGSGLPALNSRSRGDIVVTAFIRTPTRLSKKEKEVFAELAEFDSEHSAEHNDENIFSRLKDLFN